MYDDVEEKNIISFICTKLFVEVRKQYITHTVYTWSIVVDSIPKSSAVFVGKRPKFICSFMNVRKHDRFRFIKIRWILSSLHMLWADRVHLSTKLVIPSYRSSTCPLFMFSMHEVSSTNVTLYQAVIKLRVLEGRLNVCLHIY